MLIYTHQEHSCSNLNLAFGTEDGNEIRSQFFIGKANGRICLTLNIMNKDTLLAQQSAMILSRNGHCFVHVILVLLHCQ